MRFDFDFHLHTVYAKHADSRMTVAEILDFAEAAGLHRIVILEHVPEISRDRNVISRWKTGRNDRRSLELIAEDLRAAEPRHPNLEVLRAAEVDADPFSLDGGLMLEDLSGLDLVLGSTHVYPGGEAFWFDRLTLPPAAAAAVARNWMGWAVRVVRNKRIHILAHPGDLVAAPALIPPFDFPETAEFFAPLIQALAETKVAFELNELLGQKLGDPYRETYHLLVRQAKAAGVKFSLGSDAHHPEGIGNFAWVRSLIFDADLGEEDFLIPPSRRRT